MIKKIVVLNVMAFGMLFLVHSSCFSQVTEEWVQRYGGLGNSSDEARSIAVDISGNVYVTGSSRDSGAYSDFATVKYNSSGVQQWVLRYDGPGNSGDVAGSIAVDVSGYIYVTGTSEGSGTFNDIATIKYNTLGVPQWIRRYDGHGHFEDRGSSLAVDISGNVYVLGKTRVSSFSHYDFVIVKYDPSGNQEWVRGYHGPGNGDDAPHSIAVDLSGNVYVTGGSFGNGSDRDYITIKYNSSGVQQWEQRYNGPGNNGDESTSIAVDEAENVYVTGFSVGMSLSIDCTTIKYNGSGVLQWVQRYSGAEGRKIAVDATGNVYVTGNSQGINSYIDYATLKYNASGVLQWVQRYNGTGNYLDEVGSIKVDLSGNVYVTGHSFASSSHVDFVTIKYNHAGVQIWVERHNDSLNLSEVYPSLEIDGSGNVYVAGITAGGITGSDYLTIKYSQTIGIEQVSSLVPERFSLSQNFPNPFNPSTNIRFEIAKSSYTKLVVYDGLGRIAATLVNEQLQPATYEAEFNGNDLSSGIYFYRLEADEYQDVKRMVLLK